MKRKYYSKVSALDQIEDSLPEWYLIFQSGTIDLENGPSYVVDEESYKSVTSHFERRGVEPVVDYEHQTMRGVEAPAAGWIKEWRWADAGISARIEWTAKAEQRIKDKEYRYYSPVFELTEHDGVCALYVVHNLGITNDPRTNNIQPLVSKRDQHPESNVTLLEQLIAMASLGLTAGATEEEVLEVIQAKLSADPPAPEIKEIIPAKLTKAIGLPEGSSTDLVMAKLTTLNASAGDASEREQRLKDLENKVATQDAEVLLAKHLSKLTPAELEMKDDSGHNFWLELAKKDPKGFEIILSKREVQIPDGALPVTKKYRENISDDDLTADELIIAKSFGIKPEDMAKGLMEG